MIQNITVYNITTPKGISTSLLNRRIDLLIKLLLGSDTKYTLFVHKGNKKVSTEFIILFSNDGDIETFAEVCTVDMIIDIVTSKS